MTILNRRVRIHVLFLTAMFVGSAPSLLFAYLGGFEQDDGYIISETTFPRRVYDIAHYNAGQFGANVQPGTFTPLNNGIGSWEKLQGSPHVIVPPSSNILGVYATTHPETAAGRPFRVIPIQEERSLVITANDQGLSGPPQEYSYQIDKFDLRGMAPLSTGKQVIKISFWACAELRDDLAAGTIGNALSFLDEYGNKGFELGYIQPGTTTDNLAYNLGSGWVDTGITVDPLGWHRLDFTLDLARDLVSIDYTPVARFSSVATRPNPLVPLATIPVVTSAPISRMDTLKELRFLSSAGDNNDKLWALDDFDFCVKESPLSDLLNGGTLCSGDKEFSDFSYNGGGDMPAAEDIYVKAITDADGNFGIRYQGAFVDGFGGGASDALIDFKVTAPEGKLIKDVHLAANPLVIGGDDSAGLVSITETFLPDNEEVVLSVYDIEPGSRKLTDWADLVDENGELAPVQELRVQKDIIAWARQEGSAATLSFIDQTFSQCDDDANNPGSCAVDDVPDPLTLPSADFDFDGDVDGEDLAMWENAFGDSQLGDADGDGDTDGGDFLAWQRQLSNSTLALNATNNAVPEPASMVLIASALTIAVASNRKNLRGKNGGRGKNHWTTSCSY